MIGISVDSLPVTGSLVAGILILAMLAAVVAYEWWEEERSHRKAEGSALTKAA